MVYKNIIQWKKWFFKNKIIKNINSKYAMVGSYSYFFIITEALYVYFLFLKIANISYILAY